MTAHRDPDRLIRTFLDEGQTDLPDRAFDAVRRDIHRTRQRVVIGPWREPDMSTLARVAIAAAAVIAIGLAWINFGPSQRGVATTPTPTPSPSPSASPSPSPSPSPSSSIPLVPTGLVIPPGTYRLGVYPPPLTVSPRVVVTLPAGWLADNDSLLTKNYGSDSGAAFTVWQVSGTVVNPCTDYTEVKPSPKPGVDGIDALANALANQPGTTSGPPSAVTIDGYRGKLVELTVTADINKCGNGLEGFHIWTSPNGDQRFVQDSNETDRIWILDVGGQRFSFAARIPARTTPADKAELEAIIQSIAIEPAS